MTDRQITRKSDCADRKKGAALIPQRGSFWGDWTTCICKTAQPFEKKSEEWGRRRPTRFYEGRRASLKLCQKCSP